ncbi:class A beta-lactamase [Actinosynnema pretiosum subsp. pretiosum]|uniref:Beta-lactamase n=2 Tax=Actinosynnema TaxID=40566 RepID=C6WI80_ACTMD|nr:class A beta-lactamase [Actinosynnema mirum]ACU36123.1 Beta-lactamase [Actinosynnema mirum DSM 43827]AXX29576.1 Beta-lactamase [Actinosynnema pretiosum subsp. pretiosum]QUF06192.1 class A beta-lactamase [Actinosynnema pretiosum subsp. pretiosum]
MADTSPGAARRRTLLAALLGVPVLGVPLLGSCSTAGPAAPPPSTGAAPSGTTPSGPGGAGEAVSAELPELAELEERHGARLGVRVVDTGSGAAVGHRADERFPVCSLISAYAAGALLVANDWADGFFQQVITYERAELIGNSPVTGSRVDGGMTVAELCDAAIAHDDSTALNELLSLVGGPEAITAFAFALGDEQTRLDRWEPDLNAAEPGDERDTSTPGALAAGYRNLVLGTALEGARERAELRGWLEGGGTVLRSVVPRGWVVGGKPGAAEYGTRCDAAIAWPPDRDPLVVVLMSTRPERDARADGTLLGDAARVALGAMGVG